MAASNISRNGALPHIDLHLLNKFPKYQVTREFINTRNACYGVIISMTSNRDSRRGNSGFYFPIHDSQHSGRMSCFTPPRKSDLGTWGQMKTFIAKLNLFIGVYSRSEAKKGRFFGDSLYPRIVIENALDYRGRTIGFRHDNLNYLVKSAVLPRLPRVRMIYHPIDIDNELYYSRKKSNDYRTKNINRSLYAHYLYPLLIMELIYILNKDRNTKLRKKLGKLVQKITPRRPHRSELFELLRKYPDDYRMIHRLVYHDTDTIRRNDRPRTNARDTRKIINESVFNFDRRLYHRLRGMPHRKLAKHLFTLLSPRTVNRTPTIVEFPNMLSSCGSRSTDLQYCAGSKFMIPTQRLRQLCVIMASDILNPVKSRYLINPAFALNVINYFQFISRPHEHISIVM
jgi:hypothetical protein